MLAVEARMVRKTFIYSLRMGVSPLMVNMLLRFSWHEVAVIETADTRQLSAIG